MRRLTTAGMMGWVLVIAMSFTALKNPNILCAGIMILITVTVLGISTLESIYARQEARAAKVGFTLFGAGYLLLAFGPWFTTELRTTLPTTRVMDYLAETWGIAPTQSLTSGPVTERSIRRINTILLNMKKLARDPKDPSIVALEKERDQLMASVTNDGGRFGWLKLHIYNITGAENVLQFRYVGHCLFALLSGMLGSLIARRIYRKRAGETA